MAKALKMKEGMIPVSCTATIEASQTDVEPGIIVLDLVRHDGFFSAGWPIQ